MRSIELGKDTEVMNNRTSISSNGAISTHGLLPESYRERACISQTEARPAAMVSSMARWLDMCS